MPVPGDAPRQPSVFQATLDGLARRFGAHLALVGRYFDAPLPHVRTLDHWYAGHWHANFCYPLQGQPCQHTRDRGMFIQDADALERFPGAHLLRDEHIQAYAGINLTLQAAGPAIGLLALFFRQPLTDAAALSLALAEAKQQLIGLGDDLLLALEHDEARQIRRDRDELFEEFVQHNAEGVCRSEFMPPIPLDLPFEDMVQRLMRNGHVVEANDAMARMYGYQHAEQMMGIRPLDINGPERGERMARLWIEQQFHIRDFESQNVDADGNITWVSASAHAKAEDGKLTHFWTKRRDLTSQKRYEASIHHKAHHDGLTGLPNRHWFQERLEQLFTTHQTRGQAFGLMLLDLNHFKDVNDTLGHAVGDELLQAVAKRLLTGLRALNGEVARMGGDEFAILVPDLTDEHLLDRLARQTLELLQSPFPVQDMNLQVGGSLGLCAYPGWSDSGSDLMRCADIAMYAAKQDGQGFLWYHPDMDRHSKRRLMLLTALPGAIKHNELFLMFQPKIALKSGDLVGFEALVRWNHPEHGLIPPNDFIPLAETSDVIQPLTRWVIHNAITHAQAWRDHPTPLSIAVNLSARNLLDEQLPAFLAEILHSTQFPPALLELEITESAVMSRPDQSLQLLSQLHGMGISLAIDDFGTGYSSLAYLARLPVDTLKIDQSFVQAMSHARADELIVRSVVSLSDQMGLSVVAEGVEDAATLDALRQVGCELAQGYYIARPLALGSIGAWMDGYDPHSMLD